MQNQHGGVRHTATVQTRRSREEIWGDITDTTRWPVWNGAVQELRLDGEFRTGTVGELTPTGGAPLPVRLIAVEDFARYVSETDIASTVALRTTTELVESDGALLVRQTSELVGPAAAHFGDAFGESLVTGVENTVRKLAGATP